MNHPLVGRKGKVFTAGDVLEVEIVSVKEDIVCEECGGEWGEIRILENACVGHARLVLKGTTFETCLYNVKLNEVGRN